MAKTYFKKYTGDTDSIKAAMKAVGIKDPSLEYRKKIGYYNNISGVGTAEGNLRMLALLKKGKLIKSLTGGDLYVRYLRDIHKYIKAHGKHFYYSWKAAQGSFEKAKDKVKAGKKTGLTCVVPCRWALLLMGINPSGFYGKNGKFTKFTEAMRKKLIKITKGGAIGKTVKQAVDKKLLKRGDILTFEGKTHTVVYVGSGYCVFDGGSAAEKRGYENVGIILDYSKVDKDYKISSILRWKE